MNLGKKVIRFAVELPHLANQPAQVLEMALAPLGQAIDDDAIESLFGREGEQLFRQRNVLLGGEAESVENGANLCFGLFNAFANLDLLVAREQRDFAHLLEIHAHRIIQQIEPAPIRLVLFFARLLCFGGIDDINFQTAQFAVNLIQVLGRHRLVGQSIINILVSEIALFFG